MDCSFKIGEIARFFGIPASTLRYWEEKGLLHPGKEAANNYREYAVEDLMTISDVVFYKNLGLQLNEIRGMDCSTPEEHGELFAKKLRELERQQELLEQQMQRLRRHTRAVETIMELREHPYRESDIDAECIVSFELIERNKLRRYIDDPYLYSRVQHSRTLPEERRGLTVPAESGASFPESSVLWQKRSDRYVTFLLREEIAEGFPNDLAEHLAHIQEEHRTGAIISRFLLCAQEGGKVCDFYKTFVEVLPD